MDEQRKIELIEELLKLTQHEKDFTGQIIIYTNLKFDDKGNIVPLTDQDIDDLDCK